MTDSEARTAGRSFAPPSVASAPTTTTRIARVRPAWYALHPLVLPPTSPALREDATRPYFLWWTDCTVADLRRHLAADTPEERAYWVGALLREANSRDVWLFTTPDRIRADWAHVARFLGRSRAMWAWLLDVEDSEAAGRAAGS